LPAPPWKPRNVARKRVAKKLKVTETTSQEVCHLEQSSRVLMSRYCVLTTKFPCLQEMPPSDPLSRVTMAIGTQWGSQLGVVVAQPPPWRSYWRSWSDSPQ
jgi:hypothetical protein